MVDDLIRRVEALIKFVNVDGKRQIIANLEAEMAASHFWNNANRAKNVMQQISHLRDLIEPVINLRVKIFDLHALMDMLREEYEDNSLLADFEREAENLLRRLDKLEIASFLSGKHDHCNAILSIHAGAGGTESCDWADMLFRMYLRWAERHGFITEIQDMQPGEEAGISRATLRIIGPNVYGYAKAERGVHRLVRISPFDANKRRHTSFCSVDVIAEIDDDNGTIEIRDDEIRIDTYRSSGKGGQHVNKTESAIRITHLATGMVVTCQNERSQYKNKDLALKTLRSRLYEKMEDEKRSEMEKFYGEKGEMGWGNQIRSYVFQPYQMVKDLRTGTESNNTQAVMDGDIDLFIHSWLRAGCPKSRRQNLGQA
ncbi:MAG: peptide chain release factor 2 [Puniceicoccales bacterium]|jgi:peptide chain release factor 2|nr:peptide chain release factor 2 [Puniceicoccales bacterium]